MNDDEYKDFWLYLFSWLCDKEENSFFRGVCDKNYLLLPSVGRHFCPVYAEINLFYNFKYQAKRYMSSSLTDLEWLATAQHYGLPTRLMDWTLNPLIAAFFACANDDKDGVIYNVKRTKIDILDIDTDPFKINNLIFINPPVNTVRISLQKGIFSIHPRPRVPVIINEEGDLEYINRMENYDSESEYNQDSFCSLHKKTFCEQSGENHFIIPREYKNYCLQNIRSLGIDELIFGDLDAVSRYVMNTHLPSLSNPDPELYIQSLLEEVEVDLIPFLNKYRKEIGMDCPYSIPQQHLILKVIDTKIENKQGFKHFILYLQGRFRNIKPYFRSIDDNDFFIKNILAICAESFREWTEYCAQEKIIDCQLEVLCVRNVFYGGKGIESVRIECDKDCYQEHCRRVFIEKWEKLEHCKFWTRLDNRFLSVSDIIKVRKWIGLDTFDWV